MKRYFGFLILIPILLWSCEPDTSDSPEPEDVFVKLYGSVNFETAQDFIVNGTDGFILFGTTNSGVFTTEEVVGPDEETVAAEKALRNEDADRDFYLVFTDPAGNPISQLSFDDGLKGDQVATSIIRTDNQIVMVGYTTIIETVGFGNEEILTKGLIITTDLSGGLLEIFISTESDFDGSILAIDDSLRMVEETRFESSTFYTQVSREEALKANPAVTLTPVEERIESVIQTNDGNLVIIGTTNDVNVNKPDFLATTDLKDIWVVKFAPDDFQNQFFEKRIGFPNEDEGVDIFERPDGSLVLVANGPGKDDENGLKDVLYVSSDANLNNNNFSEFSTPMGEDVIKGVALLSDGGLAVTGVTDDLGDDKTFLLRISSGGSEVFFETIDSNDDSSLLGGAHEGNGVTEMNNGNLAIIGSAKDILSGDNSQKGNEILFFNTDGFGQLLEDGNGRIERTFGGNDDDSGEALIQLPDGRFILIGTIDFEGNSTMMSLIKTSARGDLIR